MSHLRQRCSPQRSLHLRFAASTLPMCCGRRALCCPFYSTNYAVRNISLRTGALVRNHPSELSDSGPHAYATTPSRHPICPTLLICALLVATFFGRKILLPTFSRADGLASQAATCRACLAGLFPSARLAPRQASRLRAHPSGISLHMAPTVVVPLTAPRGPAHALRGAVAERNGVPTHPLAGPRVAAAVPDARCQHSRAEWRRRRATVPVVGRWWSAAAGSSMRALAWQVVEAGLCAWHGHGPAWPRAGARRTLRWRRRRRRRHVDDERGATSLWW